MAELHLSNGRIALIDDQDVDLVSRFKWRVNCVWQAKDGRLSEYVRSADRNRIFLHRFILAAPAGVFVDHVNGDGLDNRRCNIRLCSPAENMRNRRASGTSGFKGVYRHRDRFRAAIRINGRFTHIGVFADPIEAAFAADQAAKQAYGEFARLNYPDSLSSLHDIPMMSASAENDERVERQQYCPRGQFGVFK